MIKGLENTGLLYMKENDFFYNAWLGYLFISKKMFEKESLAVTNGTP